MCAPRLYVLQWPDSETPANWLTWKFNISRMPLAGQPRQLYVYDPSKSAHYFWAVTAPVRQLRDSGTPFSQLARRPAALRSEQPAKNAPRSRWLDKIAPFRP